MYDYLDLLARRLDDRQKRVCCRTENTVVAAGAGSGKTQVLATRFAWLVMSKGIPAKDILTLTFTKKAAGEMYERIYQTLAFFAHNNATPRAEKERAQAALDSFGETHIQTFDSYCASIVRQTANRYGIRPDFTAGTADTESAIRAAALPFVLTHRNNPAVRAFADAGGLQKFAETVLAGTVNRYATLADDDTYFSDRLERQRQKAESDLRWFLTGTGRRPEELEDAQNLSEIHDALHEKLETAKPGGYTDTCRLIEKCIGRMRTLYDVPAAAQNDVSSQIITEIDTIATLVETLPGKGYTTELRAVIKSLRENALTYLSALCAYLRQYDDISALFALLDRFHAQVKRDKRISGSLSFRDIQKLALLALREQDDLRAQEHVAYRAVMIDEFQDNNGENRDLLFLICSPVSAGSHPTVRDIERERLFFVGDEKQSIYQFRGADVSVFNALQRDFKETFGAESVLPMEYNYRSSPALITSFNRLFGGADGIFPAERSVPDYEAQYTAETKKYDPETARELPAEPLTAENVALHFCLLNKAHFKQNDAMEADDRADLLDEKEQVAHFIAHKIRELRASGADFHDIAILDRSRTNRGILTKWLNALGIPYRVDMHTNLFASGVVFDLYNFLRLCAYPNDRTAYAAYLTSPFAALSENAVETILASGDETPDLSPADEKRLRAAQRFLDEQRALALSQPLTRTLQTLWYETGYRYETFLSTRAALCAEQFDLLYELARQCDTGGKSVAWFVDQLALLKNGVSSSFGADDAELDAGNVTYPIEQGDAVQILTIHKSKGLQYKHVFVCGCTGVRSKYEKDVVFFDDAYGVSVRPEKDSNNYFVLLQGARAKKKELAEFRRLLYVAITRAEEAVYVVGSVTPTAKKGSDEGSASLKLIEGQLDCYYPQWQDDLDFALGHAVYTDGAPFDFHSLLPLDRTASFAQRTAELPPQQAREALITACADTYAHATPVTAERARILRTTPHALETEDAPVIAAPRPDPYDAVSAIIDSYAEKAAGRHGQDDESDRDSAREIECTGALQNARFSYADFGTLAHAYLEAFAHGTAPQAFVAESKLFKHLTETEAQAMREACAAMTAAFAQSKQGTALQDARARNRLVRSEYAFRTVIADRALTGTDDELLVTGVIDLLFENADGTYTIVDYKSDRLIRPALYHAQQACYRIAAARLLGCPEHTIRCYLYYLRYDLTIEVSGAD